MDFNNTKLPENNDDVASVPAQEATYLKLEHKHPIYTLWQMQVEASGRLPAPALQLNVPPGQPELLTPEETRKELSRLLFTVTSTANKRLLRATPDSETKDRPDAPDSGAKDSSGASGPGAKGSSDASGSGAKGSSGASGSGTKDKPGSPDMDAEVVVFTTADDLAAWLLLYPPIGAGAEPDRKMMEQVLKKNGIRNGVDDDIFDTILNDTNRYFHMHLAARGESPVHGNDGRIEDLFSRVVKRTPKMNDSGKIDYTELNLIQNVREGETICRIFPATKGTSGTSVKGKPIPCKPGKPVTVPMGRNTALSEDGNCLLASISGRVDFNGRSFEVKPVLEIEGNVDYSTGNINFLGDVTIAGDICTGFNVKALGSITVRGVVEACNVEAGGDLTLEKGVKGDSQAVIQAHRSLYAKYLENSIICVRQDLYSDCIINCDVYSDGSIYVNSGRGMIIGGSLWASNSVHAKTVGTRAESTVKIRLGGLPSAEFDHESLQHELNKLTSLLELLEQQPDSPAKAKALPTVRTKINVTIKKLNQYKDFLADLHIQEYVQKYTDQRLICDIAYPGTELSIGSACLPIKTEIRYCKAALLDGEIRMI